QRVGGCAVRGGFGVPNEGAPARPHTGTAARSKEHQEVDRLATPARRMLYLNSEDAKLAGLALVRYGTDVVRHARRFSPIAAEWPPRGDGRDNETEAVVADSDKLNVLLLVEQAGELTPQEEAIKNRLSGRLGYAVSVQDGKGPIPQEINFVVVCTRQAPPELRE